MTVRIMSQMFHSGREKADVEIRIHRMLASCLLTDETKKYSLSMIPSCNLDVLDYVSRSVQQVLNLFLQMVI